MLYGIVLGIHVCTLSAALLSFVAREVLLMFARGGRRSAARVALLASRCGGVLASMGVLAGIVLVLVGGWPLMTPWLLMSMAVIAVLMVVERRFVRPWEARMRPALGGDMSIAQLKAFASEKTALIARATMLALFGVVAALMATKPGLALFQAHGLPG